MKKDSKQPYPEGVWADARVAVTPPIGSLIQWSDGDVRATDMSEGTWQYWIADSRGESKPVRVWAYATAPEPPSLKPKWSHVSKDGKHRFRMGEDVACEQEGQLVYALPENRGCLIIAHANHRYLSYLKDALDSHALRPELEAKLAKYSKSQKQYGYPDQQAWLDICENEAKLEKKLAAMKADRDTLGRVLDNAHKNSARHLDAMLADLVKARRNLTEAKADNEELMSCVRGSAKFGAEAEDLRLEIASAIAGAIHGRHHASVLQGILDRVDARDSLAFLIAQDDDRKVLWRVPTETMPKLPFLIVNASGFVSAIRGREDASGWAANWSLIAGWLPMPVMQ